MIFTKLLSRSYFKYTVYSQNVYYFSAFKKEFRGLVIEDYNNLGDMVSKMKQFESKLEGQQKNQYERYMQKLDKKMKRLACKGATITTNPPQFLYQSIFRSFLYSKFEPSTTNIYCLKLQTQILSKFLSQQQINIPGIPIDLDFTPKIPSKVNFDILYEWYNNMKENNIQFYAEMLSYYCYLDCQYGRFRQAYTHIIMLFQLCQQQLCKNIFVDYSNFAKEIAASQDLKKQRVYKGDYKFQLVQLSSTQLSQLIDIIQILCQFGQVTKKIMIATQLIIQECYAKVSIPSLGKIFQILTISAQYSQQLDSNLMEIVSLIITHRETLTSQQYRQTIENTLYYILSNKLQNRFLVQQLIEELQTLIKNNPNLKYKKVGKFTIEYYSCKLFAKLLKKKYSIQLPFQLDVIVYENKIQYEKMAKKDIVKLFLDNNRYSYQEKQCPLTGLPTYYFDNDRIVREFGDEIKNQYKNHQQLLLQPLPTLFYNPQYTNINYQQPLDLKIALNNNFLSTAVINYSKEQQPQMFIKSLNLSAMYQIDTTTNKQDFVKSKLKGVAKPYKKRVRIFDFGSPQQK